VANLPSAPPRVVTERRAPRRRTFLGGKAVFGEGQVVNCTIRDLSEGGAKITLARGDCVPTHFFLIEPRSAMAYKARVSWIKAPDFGVAFLSAYPLDQPLPTELRHVARVWATFRPPAAGTRD
jgi:hypothetical protein